MEFEAFVDNYFLHAVNSNSGVMRSCIHPLKCPKLYK